MDNAEGDDDWTSGIPIALPLPALKQQAHDLFDPIWRDDRTVTRGQAYEVLARAMGIPEPQAHFKVMTRHRIVQALAILPGLRADLRAYRERQRSQRASGTRKAASGAQRAP